jgi:short-subunit dehydrogenase
MTAEGKWAIITGASSGIGKALAFEFAAGGFNVFLTGRNEAALADVAAECAARHRVETEIVCADLARMESVDDLVARLGSGRRYEVLVNNAGFGIHGGFASTDIEQNVRLLNVQLSAALKLVQAVLPSMISRRSGRILNVASVYSFSPVPFQSVYGACKAFLLSFSLSLRNELKGTGVGVTVFCPGVTQTEFRSRAGIDEKRKDSGMTAQAAAHIAYLETLRGKPVVVPGLINRLYVFFAQHLPARSVPRLVRFINRRRGQSNGT